MDAMVRIQTGAIGRCCYPLPLSRRRRHFSSTDYQPWKASSVSEIAQNDVVL